MLGSRFWLMAVCLILSLSACEPYMLPHWRESMLTEGIKGAPIKFNLGWRDGCASGSATAATHLQRMFHGFKINEEFVTDDEYYNGWEKGFRYCHRYLYQYHRKDFSN